MNLDLTVQIASDVLDPPKEPQFKRWVRATLAATAMQTDAQLTIRVVDQEEMARLNQTYRHKQGPTNVLAFCADIPEITGSSLLGDIVICAPVVVEQAQAQHKSLPAHWAHMVVHGVLHLQGYDHQGDSDAEAMETLEIQILDSLGYPDPYENKGACDNP